VQQDFFSYAVGLNVRGGAHTYVLWRSTVCNFYFLLSNRQSPLCNEHFLFWFRIAFKRSDELERLLRAWFRWNCLQIWTREIFIRSVPFICTKALSEIAIWSRVATELLIKIEENRTIDLRAGKQWRISWCTFIQSVYRGEKNRNRSGVTYTQHLNLYTRLIVGIQLSEARRKKPLCSPPF
jgi:hypothetical protein